MLFVEQLCIRGKCNLVGNYRLTQGRSNCFYCKLIHTIHTSSSEISKYEFNV